MRVHATASSPRGDVGLRARGGRRPDRLGVRDREPRVCVASVSPRNAASLALVRSLGFRQVGEQIDEVDGLELVFERVLSLEPGH